MSSPNLISHSSPHGVIRLRYRSRSKSFVYEQRGGNQSAADANGISVDGYVHALFGLAAQSTGNKTLMIGCGGGTLANMLHKAGRRVTVVDIDKVSFKLARRYFKLPRAVECHVDDGVAYLWKTRRQFDVIVVDVFVGETIPAPFFEAAFFEAVRKRLNATGFMLMNVCLAKRADDTADRLAVGFKKAGLSVRVLDAPGPERNAVVLAGNVRKLRTPRLEMAPATGVDEIVEELSEMHFRRTRRVKS